MENEHISKWLHYFKHSSGGHKNEFTGSSIYVTKCRNLRAGQTSVEPVVLQEDSIPEI